MNPKSCRLTLRAAFGRTTSALSVALLLAVLSPVDAVGQVGPGPRNPPALPANPKAGPTGTFGASPVPSFNPTFPNPNGTTWTALGPAPLSFGGSISGRITGIAVDPTTSTTIYIAAAGGGVWKTTDGGATWTPLTDSQNSLAMGAIAIAPTNNLKLYAGTGEANNSLDSNYGVGILVSSDGGATWTLSTGPGGGVFFRLAISKISVDPTTDQIAYAAVAANAENGLCCSNTGIYKTTDGGNTWTNTTSANGKDASSPWSDVVVDPNSHSTIYAAHGDPGGQTANGVYRSLDGGATWTLLSGAPSGAGIGRIALAVAPSASTSGQHVLYVAIAQGYGGLYQMLRSNNADAATPTFTNLTATPDFSAGGQGWYDWIIAVDPSNANNVYAAGSLDYNNNTDQCIRSVDGGAHWTDITTVGNVEPHTDSHAMAFDSSNRLLLGTDGGIWRYDSTAPSWTNLNGNLNTIQFTGIGLHPTSNQTIIGGSQDNGTERSTGNVQWTATDGGDGGFSQFSQTNPSIVYGIHPIGSFSDTTFFRVSTNGGTSWVSRTPTIGDSNQFNFYSPIFVDPLNGNRVFLGGDKLYESTNAGVTWTSHANPGTDTLDSIAVLPNGNTIYIATGGSFARNSKLWVSTDDGTSFTQHSLPVGGRVNEIDIDPNDSTGNTAVAVINTFNGASGQVYRTVNGGTSWSNITGNLPQVPAWSAKIDTDANHTLYVSNEGGVYSSPSPYGTWATVGTGLPNAQAVHLQLNSTLGVLAVGTHGRGAWYFKTTAAAPATITVGTNPAGNSFTVDSVTYTSTQTFNWTAGSTHTIACANSTVAGSQCTGWSDGLPISHTVTAPATSTTYTANFVAGANAKVVDSSFTQISLSGSTDGQVGCTGGSRNFTATVQLLNNSGATINNPTGSLSTLTQGNTLASQSWPSSIAPGAVATGTFHITLANCNIFQLYFDVIGQ